MFLNLSPENRKRCNIVLNNYIDTCIYLYSVLGEMSNGGVQFEILQVASAEIIFTAGSRYILFIVDSRYIIFVVDSFCRAQRTHPGACLTINFTSFSCAFLAQSYSLNNVYKGGVKQHFIFKIPASTPD